MRYRVIIAVIIISVLSISMLHALAWDDCPFGMVNDPWPGQCPRYVDTDNNGICDHSEPEPTGAGTAVIETPPADDQTDNQANQGDDSTITGDTTTSDTSARIRPYHALEIGVVLTALYLFTYALSRKGRLSSANHKRLWNWLLLGTFLASGILGLMLAISLTYGWVFPLKDSLYIHVEFGIAMAFISIYHVLWHWKYYKTGFGKKETKETKNRKKSRRRN